MNRLCKSNIFFGAMIFFTLATGMGSAQQATTPHLQQRPANPDAATGNTANNPADKDATAPPEPCTLPKDVSGAYAFDRDNESIEIDVDRKDDVCHLSGYITRLGDRDTDKITPLTFFFNAATVSGNQVSFTTKALHGTFYTFTGTILRGRSLDREQEGYYALSGKLSTHHAEQSARTDTETQTQTEPNPQAPTPTDTETQTETRTVLYKSLGRYAPQ